MEYKSNFLKNVIFRLDYDDIKDLEKEIEPSFTSSISENYAAPIKKTIKGLQVTLDRDGAKTIKEDTNWVWEYQQKNCENKKVSLLKNALIFECQNSEYKNFLSFLDEISFVLSKFLGTYNVIQFNRMGLRYINEIFIPGINPLKWSGYINPNLCTAIDIGMMNNFLPVRSMHQLEIKDDEINILFNYGIFNKDYPNSIAKPELILDYDYYINSVIDKNEVLNKLKNLNILAERMFEESIEDKLRAQMGGMRGEEKKAKPNATRKRKK